MIVAVAPWAYVGFDNIPQTAEEFNFSPNKTFKLIVYSLLAASFTYIVMILYTGWLSGGSSDLWLTGSVTREAFGTIGLAVLSIAIIMGIFTGLNGFLLSSSRLLFSMGRSGIMPSLFSQLHKRYKTPYVAIMFLVAITLIAPWLGRTALTWIVDMSSTGVSIAYLVTCLAAAKLFSFNQNSQTYGVCDYWLNFCLFLFTVIIVAIFTGVVVYAILYCVRWLDDSRIGVLLYSFT